MTEKTVIESESRDGEFDLSHLDDVEDGDGCVEIWEKISEQNEE